MEASMLEEIFTYQFLQNALIAGVLASIVCGLIGVIIVERKMIMIGGGIAHTAYGGVGLGYLLGFSPIIGACIFAVLAAFGIGAAKRKGRVQTDILIALFWSLGMALGIAFIGMVPGYAPDISTYLFGNILTVTRFDLILMGILTAVAVFIIVMLYQDWKFFLFDSQFAEIRGIKVKFLEYLLLVLIALAVVVLIRVAGIILVIALLAAPAACACLISKRLKNRMLLAIGFGILFCFAGIALSYAINIASGAAIVIISVVTYAIIYICALIQHKKQVAERRLHS
ncbi:MAG TPA: metal ABC transporter permease [Methanocorpusculum sp.]|nr:metal ABC transporter permease [Methanocorpusculum sp.]